MTKSSIKVIKKKPKLEKNVGKTKNATGENSGVMKKEEVLTGMIKKLIETNIEDVDIRKIKNNKNSEDEVAVEVNEKLKNSTGRKTPRAPKSEVKSDKLYEMEEKMVKRRRAAEDSSLPVKKKSKTALGAEKISKISEEDESAPPKKPKSSKNREDSVGKVGNLEMTEAHVRKCVQAVLQLAHKSKEVKKSLLPEDDNVIFLQVNCIKIPKIPRRQLRVFLPHMMVGPTDEVALFVPDLEKGRRKDYEKTIDHWETILRENNVSRIKEVIPMNKVKTEYSQYEMKLKLGRLFDFFLVDGRIAGHMNHLLGKTFRRSARPPTPVKIQRDNLKSQIENALRKTSMEIHGSGNCHTMQVASLTMSEQEIVENIMAACKALAKEYPGGWENIRSVLLKTTKGLGIPVYYSIQNKNKVPVAKIAAKRPKAFKTIEGELSTTLSNVMVEVQPGGKVALKKIEEEKPKEEKA